MNKFRLAVVKTFNPKAMENPLLQAALANSERIRNDPEIQRIRQSVAEESRRRMILLFVAALPACAGLSYLFYLYPVYMVVGVIEGMTLATIWVVSSWLAKLYCSKTARYWIFIFLTITYVGLALLITKLVP